MAAIGSDEAFSAYLTDRDYQLPPASASAKALRQRATDYLNSVYGPDLCVDEANPAFVEARELAVYAAAYHEGLNPGSLSAAASQAGAVKRKKLDVLETEYFEGSGNALADATVRLSAVDGLLSPFMRRDMPAVFVV